MNIPEQNGIGSFLPLGRIETLNIGGKDEFFL